MKKDTAVIKKLLVVAIILAVVTISIIAFVGVYTKKLNKMSNIIPNYTLGTEFNGNREYEFLLDQSESEKDVYVDENGNISGEVIKSDDSSDTNVSLTVDSENAEVEKDEGTDIEGYTKEHRTIKENEDDVLTPVSYNKSKSIMEKRLEEAGVSEYNVRLDEITGKMVVEIPDDENSAFLQELVSIKGKFIIIDAQTGLELMNNSQLKTTSVGYGSENGKYKIYLQIEFNKDGSEKLKEISNKYTKQIVEKTADENTTEENSEETKTETKIDYIEIKIDDETIMKPYFEEEISGGLIQIPLSSNIDNAEDLKNILKSANAYSNILNSGEMPNKYELKNDDFLKSTITENDVKNIKIALGFLVVIVSVGLVIKFGLNGLLGAILNVGYLAVVSLLLRYTNVTVTISTLVTAVLIIGINFKFMIILLSELKNDKLVSDNFATAIKKLYLSIIPVVIVAFTFSFMQNASITGIGMPLFWAMLIHVVYNYIFTRSVYELNEK